MLVTHLMATIVKAFLKNMVTRREKVTIGTTSTNSVESDLGCTLRVYFDNLTLTSHNVTLASQKQCQYNSKFDCDERNGYNIPQDALNEV